MSGPGAEWLTAGKVKYITCTPILVDRQCWGVIGFENWHDAFPLPDADILALETAASLIGAAIHRDRIEKDLSSKQAQLIHAGRITAMGEMASGIAHEMNQPLTVINLSADVCTAYFKKNAPGVPEAEAADDIREQVKKIARLVQNMRSFSRRSSGKMSRINLADPLQVALTFFRQQFRSHRINLVEEVAAKLPLVSTNQQRIEQIAVNLLSNARYAVEKRMEEEKAYRGEIKIRLSKEVFSNDKNEFLKMNQAYSYPQQGIVFEVIDNGTGMDDEVRKRCLEPFYTTREVGEGAGLGLSVTYGLIKALGFSLEIESKKNIGSTFRVIIPIQKEERFAQEL
jgi:histidine kinase